MAYAASVGGLLPSIRTALVPVRRPTLWSLLSPSSHRFPLTLAVVAPILTRSGSLAVRKLLDVARTYAASTRFVFPWPLSPDSTLSRGPRSMSTLARLRKSRMLSDSTASERSIESDTHRHHDRKKLPRSNRLHDRRIKLSAEAELDFVFVEGGENVEKISRVEADGHVRPGILDRHFVEPFATFR